MAEVIYEVEGVEYAFPDDMTEDQVMEVMTAQGVIPSPDTPSPELPVVEDPVERVVPGFTSPRRQAEQVAEAAQATGIEAALMKSGLVPKEDQAELQRREIERARIALERERGRVVTGGREEPELVERGGLPMFRPSRIKEVPSGVMASGVERLIRDPATGRMRPPTASEEIRESFARQTKLSEDEARRLVAEGDPSATPMGILATRESGEGVVETAAGATLRGLFGIGSAVLGEGYFRGLGYEVDPEGNPADPDDFGVALKDLRETLGLPASVEYSPTLLATWPLREAMSLVGFESTADALREKARALDIPLPGFGSESTTRGAWTYDLQNLRQASTAENVTARIAQNLAAGRNLGDELRDIPASADFYEEVWGDPDAAYWVGMIPELGTPAGPGVALKGVGVIGKGLGKAAPLAADAAHKAANTFAKVLAYGEPEEVVQAALKLKGAALDMMNTPGMQKAADLASYARPGPVRDAAVVKSVSRAVVNAAKVSDDLKASALAEIDGLTKATIDTAIEAVGRGFGGRTPEAVEAAREAARRLRMNIPDDYVQVTENIAVPRHVPGYDDFPSTLKRYANADVKLQIQRNPDSKARLLRDAANGQWEELLGYNFTVANTPATTKALNALAGRLTDAAIDTIDVALRTDAADAATTVLRIGGKLDKFALKEIEKALRGVVPDEDVARALANYRTREVSEIMKGLSPADQTAVAAAAFKVRKGLGSTARTPVGQNFEDIPPQAKRIIIEALKARHIESNAGALARKTSDLSALQLYAKDLKAVYDWKVLDRYVKTKGQRQLLALMPGFKLRDTSIGEVQEAAKLKRLGRGVQKTVEKELKEILAEMAKSGRSVDAALDSMLRSRVSDELDPFTDTAWESLVAASTPLWARAIQKMYPKSNQEDLLALLGRITGPPTVKELMEFDKVVKNSEIAKTGFFSPVVDTWHAPDFQKVILDLIIDAKLKPTLAKESQRVRDLMDLDVRTEVQKVFTQTDHSGAMDDAFRVPDPLRVPVRRYGRDPEIGKKLAEGGAELVEFLEAVAPKHRRGLFEVIKDAGAYLAGPGRLGLIQSAKYGYAVPNIVFGVYKGIETPFKAAAMSGVDVAMRGTGKAAADAARWAASKITGRQTHGGGLTAPDGVHYTGEDLLKLAEQEGIGYTAITAERVGSLADDILAEVARFSGDTKKRVWDAINPAQKGFWIRTAEALERSFRQGAFEARLLAGDSVREAAEVARRSQFDFDEVPDVIRARLGGIFQGAGTAYKLATELVVKGLQNPRMINGYVKSLKEHQRLQDPYGLGGDQTLTNVIVGEGREPDAPSYYMPIPFSRVITNGVNAAAWANNAVVDFDKFVEGVKGQDRSDTIVELMMEGGLPLIYTAASAYMPGVLDAFKNFDPVNPAGDPLTRGDVTTEKMLWSSALLAANNDPTHETGGAWDQFIATWEPEMVPPPANRAMPGYPNYWRTAPEGMPYILRGEVVDPDTKESIPLYMAMKPSTQSDLVAAAVKAIPTEAYERGRAALAAWETKGKVEFEQDKPKMVHARGVIKDDPKSQLMNLIFNPTGINFNDPEGARKALAERALVAREVVE